MRTTPIETVIAGFFVITLGLTVSAAEVQADDLPPGVVNTQNPADISLSPKESLARIVVPDGFHVTQFAAEPGIRRPIAFDFDDRGRLWVVENYSHPKWKEGAGVDRIVILEDTNQDGQFDQRKVFWDKGRYLTGIAVGHGGVWLANTPELTFIADRNGDDVPDSSPVAVLDGFQISTNNVLNNFHWGPDGWLYGAIGLSTKSLVGKPGTPPERRTQITRGIWRYHPIRQVFEKVAEGMVNPWGADFNEFGDLITANTVLAHLWHIVPGMYCERRASERDNPYAYQRIQTIANHLHWGGGGWQESRNPSSRKGRNREPASITTDHEHDEEYHQHSVAGGGHAHCGAMIYLGDNWPARYRGAFFTNNLHGNRVNSDRLEARRSTYVGIHSDDVLFGNDPWFRGMSIKYGPDGGVYITDWHDFGECHDGDGSHRSTGRIYKMVFDAKHGAPVDLARMSDSQLVEMHRHPNEWFVRHARRLLHERSVQRDLSIEINKQLWWQFYRSNAVEDKLRSLWTLYVIGAVGDSKIVELLKHPEADVRRWAVRFSHDELRTDTASLTQPGRQTDDGPHAELIAELAASDPSAKVRLEIACSLQRVSQQQRLKVATALLSHATDATDPYLPLMTWYGLEPAVWNHPEAALGIARQAAIPLVRQFIARRLVDDQQPKVDLVIQAALEESKASVVRDLVVGMQQCLQGRGSRQAPAEWNRLFARLKVMADPQLRSAAIQLATIFGDKAAISELRNKMKDISQPATARRAAFQSLVQLADGVSIDLLHQLVQYDELLRSDALQQLVMDSDRSTGSVLLNSFSRFEPAQQREAVNVLVTRQSFAQQLVSAIQTGTVDRSAVSAFALQQLRAFRNETLQQTVTNIWAVDADGLKKADEITRLKNVMTAEFMHQGSASAGRAIFNRTCSKCHTLYGEGGSIAPNLTGSGRKKTDYVLQNLIDPSAEIDAAYRLTTVVTTDGRLLSGFIIKQNDRWLVLRTQDAEFRLPMNDVDEIVTSNVSMMPEGMLRTLSDEQFRDLLVYLATDQQVPLVTK